MIIVLKPHATEEQLQEVLRRIEEAGLRPHISRGEFRTIVGAIGDETRMQPERFTVLPGVDSVTPIMKPYKLASREFHEADTVIDVRGRKIGGQTLAIIAGPCAVESRKQLLDTARLVKRAGAQFLRGGAFKPRTSPYAFQGLGAEGLKFLEEARQEFGLPIVTEVLDPRDVEQVARVADVMQIGARNTQNFRLLQEVGQTSKPVLLKRGPSLTVREFLMAAEYIMSEGNHQVILCERGVRSFDDSVRNMLDLSAVPNIQLESHLPIIVDPSHGTGRRDLVAPMALAAVAAGAHGLLVEVHPDPENALSDGPQSLHPEEFADMMSRLVPLAKLVGRQLQAADK
jgi:3-deoxy-7-phosphoheptulonate synthase